MMKLSGLDGTVRSILIAAGALMMVALLGACNTFEGLGQDTQRAGEALEDEAQ